MEKTNEWNFTINDFIELEEDFHIRYFEGVSEIIEWNEYLEHYIESNLYTLINRFYHIIDENQRLWKQHTLVIVEHISEIAEYLDCYFELTSLLLSEVHKNSLNNFLKSEYEKKENWKSIGELDPIKVLKLYKKSVGLSDITKETLISTNRKLNLVLD